MLNGFIDDCYSGSNKLKLDESKPLYIIELGAGLGKFSFHFFNALIELERETKFPLRNIVYVMTDFTDSNFKAWQSHPSLKQFFETGQLDAAIFNAVEDNSITLHRSKVVLSAGSVDNPVVVIANYLFDTLYHDVFHIEDGELKEGLISTGSTADESADPLNPDIIDRLDNRYKYVATSPSYYSGEEGDTGHLEWVLRWYLTYFSYYQTQGSPQSLAQAIDATVLLPLGAIRALTRLTALSNKRALILSGDKGHADLLSFQGQTDVDIAVHGSFSLMVNYHALSLWFASQGGYSFLDPHENSDLLVNAFVLSGPPEPRALATSSHLRPCADADCELQR